MVPVLWMSSAAEAIELAILVEHDWMWSSGTVARYAFIFDLSWTLSVDCSLTLTWKPISAWLARINFTNLGCLNSRLDERVNR